MKEQEKPIEANPMATKLRVHGFVDGFNLYHALDKFEPAAPVTDPDRYRKYKWLCLTSLLKRFVRPHSEELVRVNYFTAYPNWENSEEKRRRHEVYISAQKWMKVHVTLGQFRPKPVKCQVEGGCGRYFQTYVEKQTDINIALALIHQAEEYDKAILLTADSDQVPVILALQARYPEKRFACLPPIGRGAKELMKVCNEGFKMTEQHLNDAQLPNPIPIVRDGKPGGYLAKPTIWP